MGFWTPSNPAFTESLATSQGLIQSNFTMIEGVLGSNTLSAGITWAQGDIPYASGVQYVQRLAKATASSMLTNFGATNNPSWVPMANVTWTGTVSGGQIFGTASNLTVFFGALVDITPVPTTASLATTDGLLIVKGGNGNNIGIYTDSSNPPTTQYYYETFASGFYGGSTVPVRKNQYWLQSNCTTIYWLPIGT